MANQTDTFGSNYVFGFATANAPSITNFFARGVTTSDAEPEVFVTATNGEGVTEAVAISKAANRMLNLSFVGYINPSFDKTSLGSAFTFLSRVFLIKKISDPVPKGQFVEVTIDAVSYSLIAFTTPN